MTFKIPSLMHKKSSVRKWPKNCQTSRVEFQSWLFNERSKLAFKVLKYSTSVTAVTFVKGPFDLKKSAWQFDWNGYKKRVFALFSNNDKNKCPIYCLQGSSHMSEKSTGGLRSDKIFICASFHQKKYSLLDSTNSTF